MRRGLVILLLALLFGVTGFALVRWQQHMADHAHARGYAQHGGDGHHAELDWLIAELEVNDEQLEKIRALHVAYHPVCEALTHRLEASHRKLDELTASASSVSPELESALEEHATVHLDCQRAMFKHFYETAECLSPSQSQKYLEKMLPFVFLHGAAGSGAHSH
ncbi:MAG: periplasmic heavy metal sensor [Verrucomicrobiales bacterium]